MGKKELYKHHSITSISRLYIFHLLQGSDSYKSIIQPDLYRLSLFTSSNMRESILKFGLTMALLAMGTATPLPLDQKDYDETPTIVPRVMNVTAREFVEAGGAYMDAPDSDGNPPVDVDKRGVKLWDTCNTRASIHYKLKGDGDPHQNFVITQKGGSLVSCSAEDGATASAYEHGLSWSITGGVNTEWASVALEVSESQSYSVSQSFTCGGVAKQRGNICVLFYQAVTAFKVEVIKNDPCNGIVNKKTVETIYAPNDNKLGSVGARGINVSKHGVVQCVGDVDRTIHHYCGPKGDASWWRGKQPGPWTKEYVDNREPKDCKVPIEAHQYFD
ncbi:hypothetical protein P168DRAFT_287062 [Aspergillus campestris IBT 28561]|uniref:Uncharacterized protein n=1 Tax=Aspergillus campestris (strain IBT 28561) TaxID=1392248 RepID=A0A2I1DGK2_ASPC2|nr:uncharacterized protein P168DRAFT_287062 [Aspergillus campestris IBT 28561]PKY09000.1 hypothetical protein P168DRAFT_287062 [Aspergillus campestris IBT 28561]